MPIILKAGRITHIRPEKATDEEWDELQAKLADEDKTEERYRALNEQTPMPGLEFSWTSRVCGDT